MYFFFSSRRRHTRSVSAFLLNRFRSIFAAEGLTKRSAVGFLLRSLIMFQTFISRQDRKSGSAGMPRPISYGVFCLKKNVLRAAQSAVRTHKFLEGDDLLYRGVVWADDDHVAGVLEGGDSAQSLSGMGSVDRERISPGDAAVVEEVGPNIADCDQALGRPHDDDPDSGMVDQLLDQTGKLVLDVLTRHAFPDSREIDESEIAGRAHHHVGDLRISGRGDWRAPAVGEAAGPLVGPACSALEQTSDHRGQARSQDVVPDSLEAIGVLRGLRGAVQRHSSPSELRDQANQCDAVALPERWSESLAMVGKNDELVVTLRMPRDVQDVSDAAIDLLGGPIRVWPARSGMVGDLVVAGVVHVDQRSPAFHFVDYHGRRQDSQGDVGDAPLERIAPSARHPRLYVIGALAPCLPDLVKQLTDHPDHDSHVDDGIDRIRAVFVWTGSVVPPLDRRHGEVAEGRVPGEQVANADAHLREDSVAV